MKNLFALLALICLAATALAHQPTIVGKEALEFDNPEISRAFYGELTGQPRSFFFNSTRPFELYVGLLVPLKTNAAGRYSARVFRLTGGQQTLITDIKAGSVSWEAYYEPFGGDHYMRGPIWKDQVPAGRYEIEVYGSNDRGKYVLAVGEGEFWGPKEILNVYTELPKLKGGFFGGHPASFLLSPFGIVLDIFVVALIFYLVRR